MKLVILFSIFATTYSNDCASVCDCETNFAACYFLSGFPEFSSTSWITSLYIYSSDLDEIEIYKDNFSDLELLVLTNCRFVKFSELERVQRERPRLKIEFSDMCIVTTIAVSFSVSFL